MRGIKVKGDKKAASQLCKVDAFEKFISKLFFSNVELSVFTLLMAKNRPKTQNSNTDKLNKTNWHNIYTNNRGKYWSESFHNNTLYSKFALKIKKCKHCIGTARILIKIFLYIICIKGSKYYPIADYRGSAYTVILIWKYYTYSENVLDCIIQFSNTFYTQ